MRDLTVDEVGEVMGRGSMLIPINEVVGDGWFKNNSWLYVGLITGGVGLLALTFCCSFCARMRFETENPQASSLHFAMYNRMMSPPGSFMRV